MNNIEIEISKKQISIEMQNKQGLPGGKGDRGDNGEKGKTGDKGDPGQDGTGDATYAVNFSFANSVFMNHQLGKHPSIVLEDSAGSAYKGFSVDYHDMNTCTVSWLPMFTGTATAN